MFQTLLVHHRGVHKLCLYKTVTKQYSICCICGRTGWILRCRLNMTGK